MQNGILNVYKESGFTSHDVVAKLRGILKQKKIGHTGTLDPAAVGVLPICLGSATKAAEYLLESDKEYLAILRLGVTTDTQDMTGTVLKIAAVAVDEKAVQDVFFHFIGDIEQLPPMYSAVRVNGKRLYEIARLGQDVERKPRAVRISKLEIIKIDLPEITFQVECTKGTYIRTLCHDIGDKLGCGGAMAALTRTRVGEYKIEEALKLGQIEELTRADRIATVIKGTDSVFTQLRVVKVAAAQMKLLMNGNKLMLSGVEVPPDITCGEEFRIYGSDGAFYGIYRYQQEQKQLLPLKMISDR
ncbi:MAG: tRNA pseudouridine(55) synthase TruB [Lachnospiraceae bacterium]|jgi:tRNA pseudouridine55 synthase|nr:tRNA pseudouridine(55) synthase TruB [Lachnospiraceae bacterium]